jgi:hypothetical protein
MILHFPSGRMPTTEICRSLSLRSFLMTHWVVFSSWNIWLLTDFLWESENSVWSRISVLPESPQMHRIVFLRKSKSKKWLGGRSGLSVRWETLRAFVAGKRSPNDRELWACALSR